MLFLVTQTARADIPSGVSAGVAWSVESDYPARMMNTVWQNNMIRRLAAAAAPTGGWGYRPGGVESAEATALAILALSDSEDQAAVCTRGSAWLASIQNADGGVPVTPTVRAPCWPTALSVLAWSTARKGAAQLHEVSIQWATSWLLRTHGEPLQPDARLFGHDTTLVGWSWVADTHSWVEPTAYAILALREVGLSDHGRVREGVRLLLDRILPDGGWNYGNTRVLEHTLRPFPAPTGIALASLAGEPDDPRIDTTLDYLHHALQTVRSPMSLGWGLIGLSAWDSRPADAAAWLDESARRVLSQPQNCLSDALLLLAGHTQGPGGLPLEA